MTSPVTAVRNQLPRPPSVAFRLSPSRRSIGDRNGKVRICNREHFIISAPATSRGRSTGRQAALATPDSIAPPATRSAIHRAASRPGDFNLPAPAVNRGRSTAGQARLATPEPAGQAPPAPNTERRASPAPPIQKLHPHRRLSASRARRRRLTTRISAAADDRALSLSMHLPCCWPYRQGAPSAAAARPGPPAPFPTQGGRGGAGRAAAGVLYRQGGLFWAAVRPGRPPPARLALTSLAVNTDFRAGCGPKPPCGLAAVSAFLGRSRDRVSRETADEFCQDCSACLQT